MHLTANKTSRPNFATYPFLWLATCFASGIFISNKTSLDWRLYLLGLLICAALSMILIRSSIAFYLILAAFVGSGAFYSEVIKVSRPSNAIRVLYDSEKILSGDPVEVEGVLNGAPELSVGGFYIKLNTQKITYKGKTLFTSGVVKLFAAVRDDEIQKEYDNLKLISGVRIRVACRLIREERYLNPGGASYKRILDQEGIDATSSIKSPLLIERLRDKKKLISPFYRIYDYRQVLINEFRSRFSVSTSGILIASLLGNRNHLNKETAEIFRDGGTFHILVISGLHITFIGGFLILVTRRFTRNKLAQFVFTNATLWLYSLSVGAGIPVIRAALMFTILSFSLVVYRQGTLLNGLGACAMLLLIWRPQDLFSQSFHLTFISLAGITSAAFPLIEKLRSIGNWVPSSNTPFPPNVPLKLKVFCELLYWSEKKWHKMLSENVWDCKLSKSDLAKKLEDRAAQRPLRWFFEGVLINVITQIFLLPVLVLYFHRISFSNIFLNLWISVLVVLQNFVAVLAVFFGQISEILALPFIRLTEVMNWTLLFVPRLFIDYNFASIRVPVYSGEMKVIYWIYFIPLIVMIVLLNLWDPYTDPSDDRKSKWMLPGISKQHVAVATTILFLAIFSLIAFHPRSSPPADGKLTVDFLDVGQGDASLITFPNGETMLIDGGGRHNFNKLTVEKTSGSRELFEPDIRGVGETVVSEFLWEKGYSKVDYILATHADADHITGLIKVAENFRVRAAITGGMVHENDDYLQFRKTLERNHIPELFLSRGDSFEIGGVQIEVLNPGRGRSGSGKSSNNRSLVLRLNFGSKKFLFTGDIEAFAENEFLKNSVLLDADIVKVAHHGSRTSSGPGFVSAAKAKYAIIQVGRKSPFGHPHKEVVDRWTKAGAKVLTTGARGTITVSTNGKNIEIQTFIKGS